MKNLNLLVLKKNLHHLSPIGISLILLILGSCSNSIERKIEGKWAVYSIEKGEEEQLRTKVQDGDLIKITSTIVFLDKGVVLLPKDWNNIKGNYEVIEKNGKYVLKIYNSPNHDFNTEFDVVIEYDEGRKGLRIKSVYLSLMSDEIQIYAYREVHY